MRNYYVVLFALVLVMVSFTGCVDDSDDATLETTSKKWLFIQTATNATSNNGTLTLETQEEVFGFTDRPDRFAALIPLENFTVLWTGNSSFAEDPPNAVLTWASDNGSMYYAEVLLTDAKTDANGFMEYDFTLEIGHTIPLNLSRVSLFIDTFPDGKKGWLEICGTDSDCESNTCIETWDTFTQKTVKHCLGVFTHHDPLGRW